MHTFFASVAHVAHQPGTHFPDAIFIADESHIKSFNDSNYDFNHTAFQIRSPERNNNISIK
ncbi:19918_t:CDS:2 [Cetraspora pellucida]|uniref:19918_t:CDS:1 n=1 Tax=Cetraspora pellucida TaxID=1433469 RepID=A0A9N8WLC2_9GLOM|nr:19918_t:CDS:2 [Cetraspora pellucida]